MVSLFLQGKHTLFGKLSVSTADLEQKSFQVRGNENIHRGGHCGVECSVSVVCACGNKVGQYVVAVGCADKAVNGKTHHLCYVCGKNITEVTCGNADIDLVSKGNISVVYHIAVR